MIISLFMEKAPDGGGEDHQRDEQPVSQQAAASLAEPERESGERHDLPPINW
jgi:hypothetical protein